MALQILILKEKVKKSTYVTEEHLEELLSWLLCVILKYRLQKKKIGKLEIFPKQIFSFRSLTLLFPTGNFHFEPYSCN